MMKKIITVILAVICCATLFACGGSSEKKEYYTVTFVQEGENDVYRTAEKGTVFTDIPAPKSLAGYSVFWNVTDFSSVQSDITVTAVREKCVFTVTYDLGVVKGDPTVRIGKETERVTYQERLYLQVPYARGYEFLGWYIENTDAELRSGTYKLTEDVILVARWAKYSVNV